jgi:hypothetical protein
VTRDNSFRYYGVTIPLASLSGSYSKNDNKYKPKSQKDPAHDYDEVDHIFGKKLTIQSTQMPQVRSAGHNKENHGFAQGMRVKPEDRRFLRTRS